MDARAPTTSAAPTTAAPSTGRSPSPGSSRGGRGGPSPSRGLSPRRRAGRTSRGRGSAGSSRARGSGRGRSTSSWSWRSIGWGASRCARRPWCRPSTRRASLHRKAARGHATGSRTYGYRLVRRGEHTEREIDAAEATVVTRVFELSAEGYGDQRIVGILSADRVPAPGSRGLWSKEILRTMLRNELYRGVAIYGKTKSVDKGGSASKREWVPKKDWTRAKVPHLRIIDDALWQRVQVRKQKTREYFVRPPDGRLVGKPDAGIVASRMLSGIARCACGGALTYMGKRGPRPKYYCIERSHRGPAACSNRHGVPMDALDRAVLECLLDDLLSDRERLWTLIKENDDRNRREREAHKAGRPNAEKEIAKL